MIIHQPEYDSSTITMEHHHFVAKSTSYKMVNY